MNDATIKLCRRILPGSFYYFLAELYRLPRQLLQIDVVRYVICYFRKIYFIYLGRKLKTVDYHTNSVGQNTISHNLRGIKDVAVRRSHDLIRPVIVLDKIRYNIDNCKVLTIGPRAEGEIFNLMGYGFRSINIKALDLLSYSPFVDAGDMHDMHFGDNSFDLIFSGFVIAYSNDPYKVASEMVRVSSNGGVIAIAASHEPLTNEELEKQNGYLTGADERIKSVDELISFFGDSVNNVYFRQDTYDSNKLCNMIAIFDIKK